MPETCGDIQIMHACEKQIFATLSTVFPPGAHVLLPQVRNQTGYRDKVRTVDALVISVYPSRGLWIAGVEIKCTRSDWKRELADPDKSESIKKYCNHWYVATPVGLISTNEVPDSWGHIEVDGAIAKIAKQAPNLIPQRLDLPFVASVLRSASRYTYTNYQEVAE